jgi:Flp pilus assembly protein TadG
MAGVLYRFHHGTHRGAACARDKARRGATAVEMALIAPAFFLLLMGTTEMCLIEGAQQLLENATYNASRTGSTGYIANAETQTQTVTQILDNELEGFGNVFNTASVTMTATAYNNFTNAANQSGGSTGLGNPQQVVVYTVTYPWKLFTPLMGQMIGQYVNGNWVFNLTSQIVVRNEPY